MHPSPPKSQKYTQDEHINKKPICVKNKTKFIMSGKF